MRIGAIKLLVLLVLLEEAFAGMQTMEIMEPILSKIRVSKLKQKDDAAGVPVETVNSTTATNETTTEPSMADLTTVNLEPRENSTESADSTINQLTEKPKESSTTVAP